MHIKINNAVEIFCLHIRPSRVNESQKFQHVTVILTSYEMKPRNLNMFFHFLPGKQWKQVSLCI